MNPTVAEVALILAQDQSSGVSAQGVITLALIVAAMIGVSRARKKGEKSPPEKKGEEAPQKKGAEAPQKEKTGVRDAVREKLVQKISGKPHEQAPETLPHAVRPSGPHIPPMPLTQPSVPLKMPPGIPPDLAPYVVGAPSPASVPASVAEETAPSSLKDKLTKDAWDRMCNERGMSGLTLQKVVPSEFGTDIHVFFGKSNTFNSVLTNLHHIRTGLDIPEDWKIQPKIGETTSQGIIRIVSNDPLKTPVRWSPADAPVRISDPVWLSVTPYGNKIFVNMKNRIGVFGTSGSGKSCVQRILGAHVLQSIDANLEVWDLKLGVESQHYEGKALTVTSAEDVINRIDWLINDEFSRRANIMKSRKISEWKESESDPAHVIIIDEGNEIIRQFNRDQLNNLYRAIEQGRALGVYFVWATQFPKNTNLPTEVRSQLNCRICLPVFNDEEARVIFKDEVKNGWTPHLLIGSGWLLVKDNDHHKPEESKARFLDEDMFPSVPVYRGQPGDNVSPAEGTASLRLRGQPGDNVPLAEGQPGDNQMSPGTVAGDIWLSLLPGDSPSLSEVARRIGRSKSTVHAALSRMEKDGTVCRDEKGGWTLPPADQERT